MKSTANINSLRDAIVRSVFDGDADAARDLSHRARTERGWRRVRGVNVFVCGTCGTHTPEGARWERQCCGLEFTADLDRRFDG